MTRDLTDSGCARAIVMFDCPALRRRQLIRGAGLLLAFGLFPLFAIMGV